MVIRDLSAPFSTGPSRNNQFILAPTLDRFLAFMIDFFIFSPVISLFVAGLSKRMKINMILEAGNSELAVIWFLMLVVAMALIVAFQASFWYFLGATPGQIFLKIKVVPFPDEQIPRTYSQMILRSILWLGSFLFFAVPFLEVLGHPLRRCFHERASDTLSVSLKDIPSEAPLALEQRFVGSWIAIFFLCISLMLGGYSFKLWGYLQNGEIFAEINEDSLCEEVKGSTASVDRLDQAVTGYLAKKVSATCLEKEADFVLWHAQDSELIGWAYWGKLLIETDSSYKDRYTETLCNETAFRDVCLLSKIQSESLETDPVAALAKIKTSSAKKFLLIQAYIQSNELLKASQVAQELRQAQGLEEVGLRQFVRTVFLLQEQSSKKAPSGQSEIRKPASLEGSKLLESFKKEFDIP